MPPERISEADAVPLLTRTTTGSEIGAWLPSAENDWAESWVRPRVTTTVEPSTSGTLDPSTTAELSTSSTTGTMPESICDPQPEPVLANFAVDGDNDGGVEDLDYRDHCTVSSVVQGAALTIKLSDCKADPNDPEEQPSSHTIDVELSPGGPIDLVVGEEVWLHYVVNLSWWYNHAFTLRRPSQELVVAGLRTSAMLPGQQGGPPVDFLDPLRLSLIEVCPFEPIEPIDNSETACSFLHCDGPCYQERRDSVRFEWSGGASVDVIDRSAQVWPDQPYWAVVSAARHFKDTGVCTDQRSRLLHVMILRYQP